jgi:hypothetical protein
MQGDRRVAGAMRGPALLLSLLCLGAPAGARAEIPDDTVMVPLFVETCLTGTITLDARRAAIEGSGQWTEIPATDLDMEQLRRVPTQSVAGEFSHPVLVRQWRRLVDGKEVRAVLATYERDTYHWACLVIVPDVRNALGALHPFRDAIHALGLSSRSTDLPHYQEHSGRLADRRRAHADVFSRSQLRGRGNFMHLSIAVE